MYEHTCKRQCNVLGYQKGITLVGLYFTRESRQRNAVAMSTGASSLGIYITYCLNLQSLPEPVQNVLFTIHKTTRLKDSSVVFKNCNSEKSLY